MTELRASEMVAAKIRGYREWLDWSRRELAEKSGLSENIIENIERGRRPVTIDDLAAIAWALDVRLIRLLPEEKRLDGIDRELAEDERRRRERALQEQLQELDKMEIRLAGLDSARMDIMRQIADTRAKIEAVRHSIVALQAEKD